jgi:response regulator RpfG family c-di-GMP phosphodiesterase
MNGKILYVDDDIGTLRSFKRQFGHKYDIETASAPTVALQRVLEAGPFAVVVADLRMPEMDGIQFLSRVKQRSSESVRIMLTAYADLEAAMEAVNEGNIFRFLTKPCPPEVMGNTLEAGVHQYRLVMAEKELLEKTLIGVINVLTDILAMTNPTAFGRASRVRRLVQLISGQMKIAMNWEIDIAAMLSQIGCVTVPEETLRKHFRALPLDKDEVVIYQTHPMIARDLIENIPRLENVAEIIAFQEKLFDGSGYPADRKKGYEIPLGARILKIALDFDALVSGGKGIEEAFSEMENKQGFYDLDIFNAFKRQMTTHPARTLKSIRIKDLEEEMIMAEDVRGASGMLLIAEGQEVTPSIRLRLKNYAVIAGVIEPIKVWVKDK